MPCCSIAALTLFDVFVVRAVLQHRFTDNLVGDRCSRRAGQYRMGKLVLSILNSPPLFAQDGGGPAQDLPDAAELLARLAE